MTVKSCEKNENSTAKLVIEIDKETFAENIEKAYRQARSKILVPGFRKGKAPRKVIEGMYGATVFYEDAINLLFPEAFQAAVKAENLDAIGNPSVTAVDTTDGELTLTVETDIYPTVTLGQYKGLEVPKADVELADAEVDAEIERLRERNARITTVERAAAMGDTVVLDFEGFIDGVAFEGGKGEGHNLKLGSGSFIPGFEDQLVGCSAGEEKTVEVVFPENYGASELAGQPATFQCKVHEVKETVKPALDDEFAKDVSEFDTLDELVADTRKKLTEQREKSVDEAFRNAVLSAAAQNVTVTVPHTMIENSLDNMMQNFQYQLSMSGMTLKDYMQMLGMNEQSLRQNMAASAEARVRSELMLEEVVKAENIQVSDEEAAARYDEMAKQSGMELDKLKEMVSEENVKNDVAVNHAIELIVSSAVPTKIEKVEAPAEAEKTEE